LVFISSLLQYRDSATLRITYMKYLQTIDAAQIFGSLMFL
jgi:hypothetical protein